MLVPPVLGGASGKRTYLLAARLGAAGLGALQLSLIARLLPEAQLAIVAAGVSLASYVQLLGEPAILGYERLGHHSRDKDDEEHGARRVAYVVLFWLGVGSLGGAAIWAAFTGDAWTSLGVALWAVSMVQLRWVTIQYLNWNDQVAFATTLLCNSAARVLAMALGAWLLGDGGQVLLLGSIGSMAVTAVISPKVNLRPLRGLRLRPLLAVGMPLAISSAAVNSMSNWPILAGAGSLPIDEFAAFAAQSALTTAVYGVTVGYVVVFGFPQVKRAWDTGERDEAVAIVSRYIGYVVAGCVCLVVAWWIGGDLLTSVFLGSRYSGHVVPAGLTAAFMAATVGSVAGWYARVRHLQTRLAAVTVTAAVVQVPLVLFLVRTMAIPGLIVGIAATGLMSAVGVLLIARLPRRGLLLLILMGSTFSAVLIAVAG